jgi:hypothetical protein
MVWDEDALRDYVATPSSWFLCADELAAVLPQLASQFDAAFGAMLDESIEVPRAWGIIRAFRLIAGYSAENYLKGMWVAAKGLPKDKAGRLIPSSWSQHDLPALAEEAGIPLTLGEVGVLKELARAVTWRARYPVPRKATDYVPLGFNTAESRYVLDLIEGLATRSRASNE